MVLTQNLERILHDMVTENAELQQQVQSTTQQLMRKEAELTRAEETIRREQQLVQAKDRELTQAQQQVCVCVCVGVWVGECWCGYGTVNIGLLTVSLCTGAVKQEGDW